MITIDSHVHSDFSSDSQASVESMIEAAIEKGFHNFCLTDHMDYDFPVLSGHTFVFDPDLYFEKLSKLTEQYQGQIKILKGIELGMKPYLGPRYEELLQSYNFDFVINSTHMVDDSDPYLKEYWNGKTKEEGLLLYFDTIYQNVTQFQNYDIVGHLDYAIRYAPDKNQDYSYQAYRYSIDRILEAVIAQGKGIEVNTSGYKYGLGHPHPQEDILQRYRELGGEIITIGSDAHKPEYFALEFSGVSELLLSLGYKYYTMFEKRQPTMLPL